MPSAGDGRGIDGVDVFMRAHDWPPYPGSQGQCMDCGFLSRRSADARIFSVEEVSIEQRKLGDVFALKFSAGPSIPWCFVRPSSEVDLLREVESVGRAEREKARAAGTPDLVQVSTPEVDMGSVLAVDRKCPEWYWYTPSLSPAQHRQERDMLRLEGERREHDRKLTEMQIDVQKDSVKIAEALAETARRTDRFTTRWTKAAFALAAVGVALVAATYLFPELGRHIGEWIDKTLNYPFGR
jgi:hypothetical protein